MKWSVRVTARSTGNRSVEEEEEETPWSGKRCMTPRVSSILGFPEEKWTAWVMLFPGTEEEDGEDESTPAIVRGSGWNLSSGEWLAPAGALELVNDIVAIHCVKAKKLPCTQKKKIVLQIKYLFVLEKKFFSFFFFNFTKQRNWASDYLWAEPAQDKRRPRQCWCK